ncbi:hypothetical protein [Salinisphaera orenii]|uniref:hypothetical protein n=1 Tax=Salinisphaera orenii TaxID=856731 RepID=UPI000DBE24DA
MNNDTSFGRRTALIAILIGGIVLMAGRGSDVGPSVDKMRLVQDRMDTRFHGVIRLLDFAIAQRKALSEDRVQFHVGTTYVLDKDRLDALQKKEHARVRLFGTDLSYGVTQEARRLSGSHDQVTVRYKRTGQDIWQLAGIQPRYQ